MRGGPCPTQRRTARRSGATSRELQAARSLAGGGKPESLGILRPGTANRIMLLLSPLN
ncbi:hypothetical protein AGR6A_pAt50084 [Agrobacterium sp. NCPPB 925]|nr:hypothetical protein AGR6A_pAt50084 [Agrobacterium sp. NCPPB 925]